MHFFTALSADRRPPPEFISALPIRKTRAGLQFTCAAATLGLNAHNLKDVWVCNRSVPILLIFPILFNSGHFLLSLYFFFLIMAQYISYSRDHISKECTPLL